MGVDMSDFEESDAIEYMKKRFDKLLKGYSIALEKDLAPMLAKYKLIDKQLQELIDQKEYINSGDNNGGDGNDLAWNLELMVDCLMIENKALQLEIDILKNDAEFNKVSKVHDDLIKSIGDVESDALEKMANYQEEKAQNAEKTINNFRNDCSSGGKNRSKGFDAQRDFVLAMYDDKKWKSKRDAAKKIEPLLSSFMIEKKLNVPVETNRFEWTYNLLLKER